MFNCLGASAICIESGKESPDPANSCRFCTPPPPESPHTRRIITRAFVPVQTFVYVCARAAPANLQSRERERERLVYTPMRIGPLARLRCGHFTSTDPSSAEARVWAPMRLQPRGWAEWVKYARLYLDFPMWNAANLPLNSNCIDTITCFAHTPKYRPSEVTVWPRGILV